MQCIRTGQIDELQVQNEPNHSAECLQVATRLSSQKALIRVQERAASDTNLVPQRRAARSAVSKLRQIQSQRQH
jgi:hypothetical protein